MLKSGYGNEDPQVWKGLETVPPASADAGDNICVGNKETWGKISIFLRETGVQ